MSGLCPVVALGVPVPCGTGTSAHVEGALGILEAGRWFCSSRGQAAGWDGVSTCELSLAGLSTWGRWLRGRWGSQPCKGTMASVLSKGYGKTGLGHGERGSPWLSSTVCVAPGYVPVRGPAGFHPQGKVA